MTTPILPPQDKVAVRVIVIGVVTAMLFSVVAVFVLIWTKHDPKDILPIATGALGAATGFLARTATESGSSDPIPVVVPPSQPPIPVEPVSPGGDPTPLPAPVDPSGGGGDPIVVDGGGNESGGGQPAVGARLRTPARRGGSRG